MKTMYRASDIGIEKVKVNRTDRGTVYMPCKVHGEIYRKIAGVEVSYFNTLREAKNYLREKYKCELLEAMEILADARRKLEGVEYIRKTSLPAHHPWQGERN